MLRLTGNTGVEGGAGGGVFEGYGVAETDAGELETRWRLVLDPDGTFTTHTTELAPDSDGGVITDSAAGTWTLAEPGALTLHRDDGELRSTIWKGDAIALDGIVFTRIAQP